MIPHMDWSENYENDMAQNYNVQQTRFNVFNMT